MPDSTTSSYITASLGLSINILPSDSAASSGISLTGCISLTSSVDWPSSVGSLSSHILTTNNTLSDHWLSLEDWSWNWSVACLIDGFSSDFALSRHVSGSFNISSSNVLALACDIVVSFRVMNDLSFDWQVLNSFPNSFNWLIFNDRLFDFFRNVLYLSLNSIVISDGSFNGNSLSSGHFLILDNLPFVRNPFDSFDLIVFDIFLFKGNVFDSGFNWNFFSDNFLSQTLTDSRISSSGGLESLVYNFVVRWRSVVNWSLSGDDWTSGGVGLISR